MKWKDLIRSKEFAEAKKKIITWKEGLEKADSIGIMRIRDEKNVFFHDMRKSRPELYAVFQLDDKTLSEAIYNKLTGKDLVID